MLKLQTFDASAMALPCAASTSAFPLSQKLVTPNTAYDPFNAAGRVDGLFRSAFHVCQHHISKLKGERLQQ